MAHPRGRIGWAVAGAIAVGTATILASGRQIPQTPPRQTFDAKAELVLVDVNVTDRDGQPVPTLTAADFELQVNGQTRPIDSLQFISTIPVEASPTTARESSVSSNEAATTGRLLLFVVDEATCASGPRARCCERRKRCSTGSPPATWSAWRAFRTEPATSSSPRIDPGSSMP